MNYQSQAPVFMPHPAVTLGNTNTERYVDHKTTLKLGGVSGGVMVELTNEQKLILMMELANTLDASKIENPMYKENLESLKETLTETVKFIDSDSDITQRYYHAVTKIVSDALDELSIHLDKHDIHNIAFRICESYQVKKFFYHDFSPEVELANLSKEEIAQLNKLIFKKFTERMNFVI